MSMAHSLEVRPPFLDHRIVEFAARLPENLKIRGGTLKFVLRDLMKDQLPLSVIHRQKEGFDIPAHHWLRTVLRPVARRDVDGAQCRRNRDIFVASRAGDARASGPACQPRLSFMGASGSVPVDEALEDRNRRSRGGSRSVPEYISRSLTPCHCMRVTIDATSALLRSAGVKSYTFHWVRHLRGNRRTATRFARFRYLNDFGRLDHEVSTLTRVANAAATGAAVFRESAWELRRSTGFLGDRDVFHASNQVRHAPRRVKLTATIHDLTCWLMPQLHTEANVRADASFARNDFARAPTD